MSFEKKLLTSAMILVSQSATIEAFELASENTMSSVVITAANSADELINAASTPEGYGNGRYELMPFKTSISVNADDINELATELDYALVQAVEKQLDNEGQKIQSNLFADTLRSYIPSSLTDAIESGTTALIEGYDDFEELAQQTTQVVFGQIQQTIDTISVSLDSISYEATRYMERFSAMNIGFNQDDGSLGSVHVSEMQSVSNITMTQQD